MAIRINPKWQLDIPGEFPVLPDNRVAFGGVLGDVTLPKDYLDFMRLSDGAALRYRDAWFLARFAKGTVMAEIDYLAEMDNVIHRSNRLNTVFAGQVLPMLPPGHITIGGCEEAMLEVLLNVHPGHPDFGKVYVWRQSQDGWMSGDNLQGLGFVADSFSDFMNALTARETL